MRSLVALLCGLALQTALFADAAAPREEAAISIDPGTRSLIRDALKYLGSQQQLNGSWSLKEGPAGRPVAMTGYVLLAFMASGNLPDEGDYAKTVNSGMQFLLDSVQPDGLFRGVGRGQYMYEHGIATTALAELYGQSRSPTIRQKLARAVEVILKSQNPAGGWRYQPEPKDADISVTVLQVVALRAAQEAGIAVPQDAITKAIGYVKSCYVPSQGGFSYQANGSKGAGFARTAAAIYSLQVLGKYDDPLVKAGSNYLIENSKHHEQYWTYGLYYASPAQYMVGGETWHNWYNGMKQTLTELAKHDTGEAHWEGQGEMGTIYTTAVYVQILSMPYQFLPLYQR